MKWLALMLLVLPVASAIDDPAGDVSVEYWATGDETAPPQDISAQAAEWYPYMDIINHGIIDETPGEIGFWIELASADNPETALHTYDQIEVWQFFEYHDEPFAVQWDFYRVFDAAWGRVLDMSTEPPSTVTWLRSVDSIPSDGQAYVGYVAKDDLRDSSYVPARAGDEIVFTGAETRSGRGGGVGVGIIGSIDPLICLAPSNAPDPSGILQNECGVRVRDEADGGIHELTVEAPRTSDVLVESNAPFRASNGLATTYDFTLRAINFGEEEKTFLVDFSSRETDWDLYSPSTITIPAGGNFEFSVAIGVPFRHDHGYTGISTVTLLDKDNPSNADSTDLYVFWQDPAQPGGHHPTLYFHSENFWNYMNTSSAPAGKFGYTNIESWSSGNGIISGAEVGEPKFNQVRASWGFGLRPGLALGLDFDTSKPAKAELQFEFPDDVATLDVVAQLRLYRDGMPTINIGRGETSLAPDSSSALVQLDMQIFPEADLLPYELYSNLVFQIDTTTTSALPSLDRDFQAPALSEEYSFLQLPLIDYHDIIDQDLLDSLSTLSVTPVLDPWNYQNPGKTAAFAFEVLNNGPKTETVTWTVEGQSGEWGKVSPGQTSVGSHKNATVFVEALVPEDTVPGIYEFLLFGQASSGTQVFTKFAVEVTTDEVLPDQARQYDSIKNDALSSAETPPLPLGLLVLALAFIALRRRQ